MNIFKHLKKYITQKEYTNLILLGLITLIISTGINLTFPSIIANLIDSYTSQNRVETKYYLITGIVLILATLFTYLKIYFNQILAEKIGKDLKDRLFNQILKHNYNYLFENKPSKILTIINNDTLYIKNTFVQSISFLLTAIFLLIGSTYLMYSLNTKLATIIVVTVPIIIITLFFSIKNKFKLFKKAQKLRDQLNKVITENIKASMLIRVFVSEETEINKFEKTNTKNKDLGLQINAIFALIIPLVQTLNTLGSVIIIYFGGEQVLKGIMTIGELTAFNGYILLFTLPLLIIAAMATMLGQSIASLNRINTIFDAPVKFENGIKSIKQFKSLRFENVDLILEDNSILKNISFDFKQGEKIGIMGLTGSGKTIFLKQIIRAIEPTNGKIYLNGFDIKEYKIEDIRKLIGFTFQENFLFNGTILENIKFGRKISDEQAIKCAQIAEVDSFVKDLKNGYMSNVGEQGNNLSGGQKQRIMIARALASNPQILILDDATSRLDISTEKKIFDNIKKEIANVSIIIVSQKIASVRDADNIYIFDDGQISEKGTHNELLSTSALYREIELTQQNYEL